MLLSDLVQKVIESGGKHVIVAPDFLEAKLIKDSLHFIRPPGQLRNNTLHLENASIDIVDVEHIKMKKYTTAWAVRVDEILLDGVASSTYYIGDYLI